MAPTNQTLCSISDGSFCANLNPEIGLKQIIEDTKHGRESIWLKIGASYLEGNWIINKKVSKITYLVS